MSGTTGDKEGDSVGARVSELVVGFNEGLAVGSKLLQMSSQLHSLVPNTPVQHSSRLS